MSVYCTRRIICEVENIQVIVFLTERQPFCCINWIWHLRLLPFAQIHKWVHITAEKSVWKNFFGSVVLNGSLREHFVVWYYWKAYYGFSIECLTALNGLQHVKVHEGIGLNEDYSWMTDRRTTVPYICAVTSCCAPERSRLKILDQAE